MFNIDKALESICDLGDRREAVENLLKDNDVRYQKFQYKGGAVNFVINFGTMWTWKKVFGAHYDRVPSAPGANDNGASIVCLIRLAVQLQQSDYAGPLAIVLFDKEEPCNRGKSAAGSRNFGKTLRKKSCHPELFVVLDVIGYGDVLIYDTSSSEKMVDMVGAVSNNILPKSTPGSDDALLSQVGIDSLLLCALPLVELEDGYPMTWDLLHTEDDSVKTVEPRTVSWVQEILYSIAQPVPTVVQDIEPYEIEEHDTDPWPEDDWDDWTDNRPRWDARDYPDATRAYDIDYLEAPY